MAYGPGKRRQVRLRRLACAHHLRLSSLPHASLPSFYAAALTTPYRLAPTLLSRPLALAETHRLSRRAAAAAFFISSFGGLRRLAFGLYPGLRSAKPHHSCM